MRVTALTLALLLVLLRPGLAQQSQKTTIFCHLTAGGTDYGNLDKFFPDSMRKVLLLNPRKAGVKIRIDYMLLWMSLHGWKVVTAEAANGNGFLMSKEIDLDEATRTLLLQNLEANKH